MMYTSVIILCLIFLYAIVWFLRNMPNTDVEYSYEERLDEYGNVVEYVKEKNTKT